VNLKIFDSQPSLLGHCLARGCDTDDRAVATDTRDPRFKSSHREKLSNNAYLCVLLRLDEKKRKHWIC